LPAGSCFVSIALAKCKHSGQDNAHFWQTGNCHQPDNPPSNGCQIFWYNIPKREKYHNNTKWQSIRYTEWPQNRPNVQHLSLQDPPKFTQIGIFGMKVYHLATLLPS
jgi:hypothetical protein